MMSDYLRIIGPSEIKVGMVIEWDRWDGFIVKCTVESVNINEMLDGIDYYINEESHLGLISDTTKVKVISEPEIIQPEEPTSFGACAVVSGAYFILYMVGSGTNLWCGEDKSVANWDGLCGMGKVEVINEDPFSGV